MAYTCAVAIVVAAPPVETITHCVDSKERTTKEVGLFVAIAKPVRLLGSQFARNGVLSGMRVAAFVSGGLIPEKLRGTSNNMRFHIVDWYTSHSCIVCPFHCRLVSTLRKWRGRYPTFCFLAGIDAADNSPTPPKPSIPHL